MSLRMGEDSAGVLVIGAIATSIVAGFVALASWVAAVSIIGPGLGLSWAIAWRFREDTPP